MNRQIKDINLPLNWAPVTTPKPRTPWLFNAKRVTLVNRVINEWITGQENKLAIASTDSDHDRNFRIPEPPIDYDQDHDSEGLESDAESVQFDNMEAQPGANSDNFGGSGPN